jgi:N-acetylglucosamine-6-sulfatase
VRRFGVGLIGREARRRGGTRPPALVAAALLALLASAAPADAADGAAANPAATDRPNVVLIQTDDQALHEMRFMPRTRRLLGDRGATFRTSLASWPLCCPARATQLTGQYAHNHGVLGNHDVPLGGFDRLRNETALPVWLQRAGYATIHIGKFLNGYESSPVGAPAGWEDWAGSKESYRFYGYELFEDGRRVTYGERNEDPDAPLRPETYSTDVYTAKAAAAIARHARDPRPFFLSLGYLAPHTGLPNGRPDGSPSRCEGVAKPAARHLGAFADEPVRKPPSFNPRDVSDKPEAIRRISRMRRTGLTNVARNTRCRAESLLAVDEGVERIVGALRRSGELDRTLIIFTSDNGFFLGEHRLPRGKNRVYEPAVRVPLLVRGPGIPRGVRVRELSANIDLAPTIADATGASPLLRTDGRSLLPLARHPDRRRGREILLEQFSGVAEVGEPDGGVYSAVRTARFKYVANASGEIELYDLRADPHEIENLAGRPRLRTAEAALRARLARLEHCAGAGCRTTPAMRIRLRGGGDECLRRGRRARLTIPRRPGQPALARLAVDVGEQRAGTRKRPPFRVKIDDGLLAAASPRRIVARVELIDGRLRKLGVRYRLCR